MASRRTLTELDEWPRHQTIDTFDVVANPSPEWSDGYWFCIGDPKGEVNLITAIRLYHNTNVIDAYVMVSTDEGRQYNVRASRRLRPRIDDIEVGPFWQKIVRGLRTIQFGCRANPYGVEFDIEWESAAPPYDEASGVRHVVDGRLVAERSNYVQVGDLSGWLRIGDREWRFDRGDGWAGARDHSWGMGGTGVGEKPNPYGAPPLEPRLMGWGGPGMRHWALVKLPTRSVYYAFLRNSDGSFSASGTGAKGGGTIHSRVDYSYEDGKEGWAYTDVSVGEHQWADGWPRLKQGTVQLNRPDGGIDRFRIDVVSKPIYMQGGGYWGGWDDGLGRGVFRGEDLVEGEVWDVAHPVKVFNVDGNEIAQRPGGSYAEVFARYTNLDDPDEVGLGMLEAVIIGEYEGIKA
ncbi:MAG: hypothetical protein QGH42_02740 [Kiritimatiellia bacterium]|nr:hypothetical protein [Pseudomonadales bacterium]MDP6473254.1 hypothetical protein [Pseudomonadales bacterium]MDP6829179.1 hypothetical protein [Pseudomonadales bacterium]MDP7023154.1 hypothetical protein [Kiritimatiellia bacterium]